MRQKISFGAVAMLIVSLLCLSRAGFAQCPDPIPGYSVVLVLNNPSPYLSDWSSRANTAEIFVTNTKQTVDVKILAEFRLNGELVAITQAEKLPIQTITPPGRSFRGEDIVPLSAVHFEGNIDQSTQRAGRVPDGQICITIKLVLASDPRQVLACDVKCATIISYSAPILILPPNNTELCKVGLNNIIDKSNGQPRPIFTWTPVVPQPATFPVVYHFAIFEVVPGMEPLAAFRGGRPVFTQNLVGITQLMWPTNFFLPEVGKRYMWSVRALDEKGFPLVTIYDGWSVPNYFAVVKNCERLGFDTDGDGVPDMGADGIPLNNKNGVSADGSVKAEITKLGSIPFDVGKSQTFNGVGTSHSQPLEYRWFARPTGSIQWTALSDDYQATPVHLVPANTFVADQSYDVELLVKDAMGTPATARKTITVGGKNTSTKTTFPANTPGFANEGDDINAFEVFYRNFKATHPKGHIGLEVGGMNAGWIFNAEGVNASDEVVSEALPVFKKDIGRPKYEDISFKCGTGMSKSFYQWVETGFNQTHNQEGKGRQNGAVIFCDYDYTELSRLNFYSALVTEFGMPALDAASKDAAKMTIKINPEHTKFSKADSGKDHSRFKLNTNIQKKWLTSNFRLKIDGLDEPCSNVHKIEAITIKRQVFENSPGEMKQGTSAVIPKLTIIFDEKFSKDVSGWHDKLVIDRTNKVGPKKTGTLTYFADDMRTELFAVDFTPVGIPPICNYKFETGVDGIRRIKVEMYCEDIRFAFFPGASFGGLLNTNPDKKWWRFLAAE